MGKQEDDKPDLLFTGFNPPSFTQVPDEFFDRIAPNLSESELRVLLYIIRRTFGFGKRSDAISLSQLEKGIVTRDNKQLDIGTGMSRSAVRRGAAGLVDKGMITITKVKSDSGEYETNVYALRFRDENPTPMRVAAGGQGVGVEKNHPQPGVGAQENYPVPPGDPGVGPQETLQETVNQERESQERAARNFEKTSPSNRHNVTGEEKLALTRVAQHVGRTLNDQADLRSTAGRLENLYASSGMDLDSFIDAVDASQAITQRQSASIRAEAPDDGSGRIRGKPKVAYFFGVLENELVERMLESS